MLPFHWKLGPLAVTPNELFAVLGCIIGGLLVRRRLLALGTDNGGVLDFVLAGIAGGGIGSRLYYFIPMWVRGQVTFGTLFTSWSDGSGYYGGFLVGALAIALTARFKKMEPLRVLDAVAATVPLGFAIGKIGCFLAGCCYGLPTPHGVKFPPGSLCYETQRRAGIAGTPVHPVPLYDMIFGFALFAGLLVLGKRSKRTGEVLAAYVACYSAYRFGIEFFRNDPGRDTFGGGPLTDSQYTAAVLFVLACAGWAWVRMRKLPAETAPATPK